MTAALLIKQKPLALVVSAWCPGGRTKQKILFLSSSIRASAPAMPAPQDLKIAFLLYLHKKVSAYGSFSTPFKPSFGIREKMLFI